MLMLISVLVPTTSFASNEQTCAQLGMIPNDRTQAGPNLKILINALNDGTKILVDNKYYLLGLGAPAKISNDIAIEGITDSAEFSFVKTSMNQSSFINVASNNLSMDNIKLTSTQGEYVLAFRVYDNHKIDNFTIKNCYFEGSIRLINWQFSNSSYPNPDRYNYGINKFSFNNNICKNINQAFIMVANVPINHSQIIGNTINNFSYVFYNQEITNANPYTEQVGKLMNYLEIKDNTVNNELSWNGVSKDKMYHCFIFFEGNKCDYIGNHVEGLHAIDKKTVVYDAYLSCIDLNYENNYWKNNITFNPNYTSGRQLFKSKGAPQTDFQGIKRIYKNNTFVVEKEYAEALKRPPSELWVLMNDMDKDIDTFIIEGNTIDVYILRLNNVSMFAHNFSFDNNNIHANTVDGDRNNCILPVALQNSFGSACSYVARNNKITIDRARTTYTHNNSLIRIGVLKQECLDDINIVFENNTINWPDLDALVSTVYSTGNKTIDLSIDQNTITTKKMPSLKIGTQPIIMNAFILDPPV